MKKVLKNPDWLYQHPADKYLRDFEGAFVSPSKTFRARPKSK